MKLVCLYRVCSHRLFTLSALIALSAAVISSVQGATLSTDKSDYPPGTTATITGSGFSANDDVTVQVLHADGTPSTGEDHEPWTVHSDDSGNFTTTWFVCTDDCVGSVLRVTATDSSQTSASATFTDAQNLGEGRVISVVGIGGACVAGPNGGSVQFWEVAGGGTYSITLSNVTDCANGGNDSTIEVMVKNSDTGNQCFIASRQSTGVYTFTITMPANACNTSPILYCVSDCDPSTGSFARRNDGAEFQAHLRAATFDASCNFVGFDSDCSGNNIGCPPNIVTNCVSPSTNGPGAYVTWPVTPGFTYTPPPGSFFPHGTTNTVIGTNSAGQTCTFTVTVLDNCSEFCVCDFSFDNCPTNTTVQCLSQVPPPPVVTATDCLGPVAVTYESETESNPGSSCRNTITRIWQATDSCANVRTCTNTITVLDTISPVLSGCPTNQDFQCLSDVPPPANVTANDNCDGSVPVTLESTTNGSCPTIIRRTWTARDTCTNSASCSQTITVRDTIPPVLSGCPTNQDFQCLSDVPPPANVTANDNCDGSIPALLVSTTNGSCPTIIRRTWTARDTCTNAASCSQTITVRDTIPPVLSGCPTNIDVECLGDVPPPAIVTATDNCDGSVPVTLVSTTNGSCPTIILRTWTVRDTCTNSASCSQTITVLDTIAPHITCPTNLVTVEATPPPDVAGVSVTDNCDTNPVVVWVGDVTNGTCPKVITRTYRATDACTNFSECVQTITVFCPNMVTDTSRCTLLGTCSSNLPGFRLIFTQDPHNMPCSKLTASNPGQFYNNVFYMGTPGSSVTFNVTLPYPFVTQGANPIEVYDSVTATTSGGQTCLTPGTKIYPGSDQVTLTNYSPQAMGSTYTLNVTVTVPSSGFVFLAIHLDYGLKKTGGYTKDANNNAIGCSGSPILIPDLQTYTFSVAGAQSGSTVIQSCNAFKRNPGVGGLAQRNLTTDSVPGAKMTLKDARGAVIATGLTDQDGWYLLNYKHTGPAATFYVTVTPPGAKSQTKTVTLKANAYCEANFTTP